MTFRRRIPRAHFLSIFRALTYTPTTTDALPPGHRHPSLRLVNRTDVLHHQARSAARVLRSQRAVTILPETPATYRTWRKLVVTHSVMGVQVHDARIAALMLDHGLTHVLTLNAADFGRYAGITPVSPMDLLGSAATPSP